MILNDRVAAWWAAWKWVALLVLALAASGWLNVWQWKRAITAPYRAQIADKDAALNTSQQLLESANRRADVLNQAADVAAGALQQADKDYRRAVATRPLDARCAPEQGRVDAVNKALGQSP